MPMIFYTQELPGEQVETEEKYIEEIEVRFEAIERETVIALRKYSQKLPPAVTTKATGTVPKNEGSVITGEQSSSSNNPSRNKSWTSLKEILGSIPASEDTPQPSHQR